MVVAGFARVPSIRRDGPRERIEMSAREQGAVERRQSQRRRGFGRRVVGERRVSRLEPAEAARLRGILTLQVLEGPQAVEWSVKEDRRKGGERRASGRRRTLPDRRASASMESVSP